MAAYLKSTCQSLLKCAGVYERIKGSWLYDAYWRIVDRRWVDQRKREIDFYRKTLVGLRPNDLIFDIGANRGFKTDIFLNLGARVIAIDPDKSNQDTLTQRFLAFRARKKPVVVVGKAVSDLNGFATLWVSEPGFEMNTLSCRWVEALKTDSKRFGRTHEFSDKQEVETITVENLISTYGRPFYIKIDVEGYELNVLKGLETIVPYVSFEVNLPEFKMEGRQCIARLYKLAADGVFNYSAGPDGMRLQEWACIETFSRIFQAIGEASVEVFWRTSISHSRSEESERCEDRFLSNQEPDVT